MRTLHAAYLAVCLVGTATVAAPPIENPIQLPSRQVVPQPMPGPRPDAKIRLAADQWYVVNSKVECVVRGYPAGMVSVSTKKGPRDISANFVDGNGSVEDRSYDGPFIYVVRASGKGDCTLVVTPLGLKSEAEIITDSLRVDAGLGPQPPPVDPVDPITPEPTKSFRVLFVIESGATYTPAQLSVIYSQEIGKYLDSRCTKDGTTPGWRRKDKDAGDDVDLPGMKTLWAAVKPKLTEIPCLVVEKNGKAEIIPLPKTVADGLSTLKTYYGDK